MKTELFGRVFEYKNEADLQKQLKLFHAKQKENFLGFLNKGAPKEVVHGATDEELKLTETAPVVTTSSAVVTTETTEVVTEPEVTKPATPVAEPVVEPTPTQAYVTKQSSNKKR